ncbi:MAG TPA: hypothetical protein PKK06_10385 [Phycisphaerae bacterium]|nr:hypothetical protein [Phycisphaerae bacterium]HNU45770.1 hypothetical protein [Phycisphaerae bacterium]
MSIFGPGFYSVRALGAEPVSARPETASSADVKELEARLERALLVCEAMWSICREKFSLSDVDLVRRIHDLDLSDGKLDGKVRKPAVTCPKCNRTIGARFPRCMYCGQPVVHDPFA